MTKYYQNIECGNIFPYTKQGFLDMIKEAEQLYDYADSCASVFEYYRIIVLD